MVLFCIGDARHKQTAGIASSAVRLFVKQLYRESHVQAHFYYGRHKYGGRHLGIIVLV